MQVGMAAVFQNPFDTRADREVYQSDLRLADLAEPLGFESIWGVEHHLTDYTICPHVLQLLTYMAGRTPTVGLASIVLALPSHHPPPVPQPVALLDHPTHRRPI